ncbi:Glyoxalase/Bleomycin resistance family protein [Legionella steigerwaltii]|uniref:Glyoxalase/Bleomycin resistance family protein n=1 Tax=Legionella steigerwaltii TaxID=460 RepID=A0A378LDA9_9GAMM|nr:VOC family protein [Legionella steigerwaltii]KTD75730.1 Glyoxalase/Bleomycin resistance family protein [Legionella steigerwaltii]STY23759.1 Glyoxalase/Bleomycin resistance family protein [Legionella steigerwaltii]
MNTLFHLAFPIHDLALAKDFYHHKLGFSLGRESEHALILKFGSHQIVAHKIDILPPPQESIYPRHFGLIFLEHEEFDAFLAKIKKQQIPFEIPLKTRFKGTRIEHQSFFLKDPSNNLLEFKYYQFDSAIFGEQDFKRIGESSQE